MNLSGNKSRVMAATKELLLRWSETRNSWRDAKSEEFQRRYLDDLAIRVDKAATIIDKLDELLRKVRSDCE